MNVINTVDATLKVFIYLLVYVARMSMSADFSSHRKFLLNLKESIFFLKKKGPRPFE